MPTDPNLIEPAYPFQDLIGFEMTDWTAERVEIRLPLRPALGNRYGLPHGGVYATMLDTVMGFSGCFTGNPDDRKLAMTLSMNVNYLSRPKGRILIAEGRKTGGGARTFFAEGRVFDETDELIATSSGTFRYRSV